MIGDNMSGQGSHSYDYSDVAGTALPVFADWPADQAKNGEYIALYPNVLLGVQLDHAFAIILHPLSHNKTLESLQLYFLGEGASSERYAENRQSVLDAWEIVFREDIFAVEGMQAGRQSPGYQGGVFSPVMDESTHHFHRWVANHYSLAVNTA
jgi:choline monooxygenase